MVFAPPFGAGAAPFSANTADLDSVHAFGLDDGVVVKAVVCCAISNDNKKKMDMVIVAVVNMVVVVVVVMVMVMVVVRCLTARDGWMDGWMSTVCFFLLHAA